MAQATRAALPVRIWSGLKNYRPLTFENPHEREVFFLATLGLAAFFYTALASFSPFDPSPYSASHPAMTSANLAGQYGAYLAGTAYFHLGVVAYLLPLPLLMMAALLLLERPAPFGKSRVVGWALLVAAALTMTSSYVPTVKVADLSLPAGGVWGRDLSAVIMTHLGPVGHLIVFFTVTACAFMLITRQSLLTPLTTVMQRLLARLDRPFAWDIALWKRKAKPSAAPEIASEAPPAAPTRPVIAESEHARALPVIAPTAAAQAKEPAVIGDPDPIAFDELGESFDDEPLMADPVACDEFDDAPIAAAPIATTMTAHETRARPPAPPKPAYAPPPTTIFRTSEAMGPLTDEQRREFEVTADNLTKAFADFGIQGNVVAIQPGPVVTVFEFQPSAGTKLSKMTGLIDDIALALKVDSIFIHPVSGKRAVGIQVPNTERVTVFLGDIVNSKAFQDSNSPLTFVMGKSLKGEPVCADLASMPHLLTAGQTGSGKSVAINSLLCSIIMKASPEEVKMILVDPKILELKIYEGIPHLLMPVITEPSRASLALKWATQEMDHRYRLMEMARVRHIGGFNAFWDAASDEEKARIQRQSGNDNVTKLPYIVIVIDELADLMLTAPKEVESLIQRLAQKARASGIHLVLATQRPSVDVITGVIKANLPCRVAFKVFSRGDSRTILDAQGAEKLLGKGDMLYLRPGSSRLARIQGAFLEDEEVVNLVEAVKVSAAACYDENVIAWIDDEMQRQGADGKGAGGDLPGLDDDPKWDEAIGVAQAHGVVSASFLQRHLKIGYNRAARIVEAMEAQGLVDKADGSKPRKWRGGGGVEI